MRNVSRVLAGVKLAKKPSVKEARLICEFMTETSVGSISQVAEGIHHRVVSGKNLRVGSFVHYDVSYQLERLEANGASEHPVSVASGKKWLIVIILKLLGSLVRQGSEQLRELGISIPRGNIEIDPVRETGYQEPVVSTGRQEIFKARSLHQRQHLVSERSVAGLGILYCPVSRDLSGEK